VLPRPGPAANGMLTLRGTCLSVTLRGKLDGYSGAGGGGTIRRPTRARGFAATAAPAPRGENMKTTVQKRLARFAGLLLLSLLVIATGVQAAQAATLQGTGAAGGGSTSVSQTAHIQLQGLQSAALQQLHHGDVASVSAATAPAGTQGRGGVASAPFASASGAQPASSSTSSTTAWIVGGAAAVLIVGFAAWALMRRRRQPGELASVAYCAQHPEDSLCIAA